MAALTIFTVCQRVWHVRNELLAAEAGAQSDGGEAEEL
jgi:hypothetical protein